MYELPWQGSEYEYDTYLYKGGVKRLGSRVEK